MSGVLHVDTREQSSEWYSGWKPEDRYGDDRRLLTLPERCATGNVAHGDVRARYRVHSLGHRRAIVLYRSERRDGLPGAGPPLEVRVNPLEPLLVHACKTQVI